MAVNMKLGIDVGAFKKGISDANAQLKTFDAQLKFAETSMKSAGNAEQGLVTKTNALEGKLKTQKAMIQQYTKALDEMKSHGVDPLSKEYQQLQASMLNTKTAMMETEQALNGLDSSQQQAATSATQLVNSVNSIGKKISIEHVITGINTITSGLETAASKAVQLGETIFSAVMDRARWADDTATMALMYGIDLDKFQRMQKLVTNGLDTSVDAMLTAQSKLNRGIGNGTSATMDALRDLGLLISSGKYPGEEHLITEDSVKLFWEAGQALMAMGDSFDKEATAQALYGRSWKELVPLFKEYKSFEDYEKALEGVQVNSEEDVNALAELNKRVSELKGNLETLSTDILAKLAPALTEGANALNGMITSLLEYLKTDAGQQMLERMGTAVSGLFESLGKIDPEKVIEGFAGVFTKIVGGLEWLTNNSGTVISALEGIVIGWGALKLTGGALQILELINGIKGLRGGSPTAAPAAEPAAQAAEAAGTGGVFWTNLFGKMASAAMKLTIADPTGSLALLPQVIMDRTIFGRHLTNGESVGEAAAASGQGILNSAGAGLENFWKYISTDIPNAVYGLFGTDKDKLAESVNNFFNPGDSGGHGFALYVEPEIKNPEEEAKKMEEDIGPLHIPVTFVPAGGGGGGGAPMYVFDHWNGMMNRMGTRGFANGIWSVPSDNYLALLHRGERVVPAREVSSRNFSSNLYVENMNMNNGQDAEGLAAAIASANRRTMSGFGS